MSETTSETRELPTRYDPSAVEARWAARWRDQPFTADPKSEKPPFSIVIPPPNVTGALHLGHAFDNTIIDTLIRYKRMRGFETLFQPGSDHAGISTQVVVERALKAEGTSRHDLGREAFVERVWAWKERYGGIIISQLQRLGVSAAWDRLRFTMDPGLSAAVRLQFVKLYEQGKVYRKERIVHWDPISQTVLSDLEVDREERPGELYELAYELEGGGAVRVATVRPETIFADVAVAVHPDDERLGHLIGQRVRIPLTDRWVSVIADEAVEIEFGTGALKITPAHDPTDYEIGERHGLPMPSVIDKEARLSGELVPAEFRGLDRFEARTAVVAALEASGELVGRKAHSVPLGLSQRTGEPVEPLLSLQWFYDTDDAAARALAALDAGQMRVTPERFTKVNRDWLSRLRPWCISRQLWWGHRIPAWYDADGNTYVPSPENPELDPPDDPRYAGLELTQDTDVFDTWFSSSLWPFSTLGWPDESDPYFQKFYPTSVLVTGYDILFFWVARMQMAGLELAGDVPFHDVVLHGLINDEHGVKMSKSKGNGVDPLDLIEEHGADALRFALSRYSTGAQDINWDARAVELGRNFVTKLWNASRLVLMQTSPESEVERDQDGASGSRPSADAGGSGGEARRLALADRWILSRLEKALDVVGARLDEFDLGAANRAAYDFVWSEFCDWYLEAAKAPLRSGDPGTRATVRRVLEDVLKLLHPFMPFVTSEIYQSLGHDTQLAEVEWPWPRPASLDEQAERDFSRLQAAVTAARHLRAEADLSPSQVIALQASGPGAATLAEHRELFESLARAQLTLVDEGGRPLEAGDRDAAGTSAGASLSRPLPEMELRLPLAGQVDVEAYVANQRSRLAKVEAELQRSSKKLANEKFVANAPGSVVEEERRRLAEAEDVRSRIVAVLQRLEQG